MYRVFFFIVTEFLLGFVSAPSSFGLLVSFGGVGVLRFFFVKKRVSLSISLEKKIEKKHV